MRRRPTFAIVAIATALVVGAGPVAAAAPFPDRIDLPSGWRPEGITAGAGTTVYVGSMAGGGVWAADVRTGDGFQLVPHWGGVATGVEYEHGANRLWVAGASTGTVRVYDASTGALLKQYDFSPFGFINDLVVTDDAVYVTDSRNPWLDVIPLGPDGSLPDAGTMLPLTGMTFEPPPTNTTNGIVATRGWLILVNSFTGALFRVDPATGVATQISTGGVTVQRGDGLELRGDTLYVVRNRDNLVQIFRLGPNLESATPIGQLTSAGVGLPPEAELSVPTTIAFQAGSLWAANARFGITTTEYWVTRLPTMP